MKNAKLRNIQNSWVERTSRSEEPRGMEGITTWDLAARIGAALLLGTLIGVERQWRQRSAGLRTYALVSLGSALFVVMAASTPGEMSPTRVAAQVVAGVGFLGAGVIMRTGMSVQGLNTAGTIWCSAAVGVLAGSAMFIPAVLGAAAVLLVNLALRPVAGFISRRPVDASEQPVHYRLKLACRAKAESRVRALIVQLLSTTPVVLQAIESSDDPADQTKCFIEASLVSSERQDCVLEQISGRLGLEAEIHGISWRVAEH